MKRPILTWSFMNRMKKKLKNIIRPRISLVLVLCFLSVIVAFSPSIGQNVEQGLKTVRLTSAFMGRGVAPVILNDQTNIESPDRSSIDKQIPQPESVILISVSASLLTELSVQFAHYFGLTTIAIRAPPCFKARK